jgi:hypothetical protein
MLLSHIGIEKLNEDAKENPGLYEAYRLELVDHLLDLVAHGKQAEAEKMIKINPDLLLGKGSGGYTAYQYTLAVKDTHMRKMIRANFPGNNEREKLEQIALQAREFETDNSDIKKLKVEFLKLWEKTQLAYKTYIKNYDPWDLQQCIDYWCRVIGGLQREWPAHWMQEFLFPDRDFDANTEFSSDGALPEAKFYDGQPWFPLGNDEGCELVLKTFPEDKKLDLSEEPKEKLMLGKQGDKYFIYGPIVTTNIEAAVSWEKRELNSAVVGLAKLPFPEAAEDKPVPLLYSMDNKAIYTGCRAVGVSIGSGAGFDFAAVKYAVGGARARSYRWTAAKVNSAGLTGLNKVRTQELAEELANVKQYLPEEKAARPPPKFSE